MTTENTKRIGKLVGFHGLKGDVKLNPSSPDVEWAGKITNVILKLGAKTVNLEIIQAKIQDRIVLCRFKDHLDRTSVEQYLNAEVYALTDELPVPEEGEFWVDDIIGLNVLDFKSRAVIGTINDLVSSGDQDYLEIIHQLTQDKVLIPLNDHFVPEIKPEEGFVSLNNLDGFFDDMVDEAVEAI